MKPNRKSFDIESFKQSVFKAEPPKEIAERLKVKMRERARSLPTTNASMKETSFWLSVDWWHSVPGKMAFACGSCLILLVVFFAHAGKPQSALAATIDAIRLAAETQQALQSAKRMHCEIRKSESTERLPDYILQWNFPDETFLDSSDPSHQGEVESLLELFSNPEYIFQSLRGIWKIVEEDGGDRDLLKAWIQPQNRLGSCVLWLDRTSKLPIKMETYVERESDAEGIYMDYWSVQFTWNDWGG